VVAVGTSLPELATTLVAALKEEAEKQGIPYQTLLGSILRRYLNGDLVDARTVDAIKKRVAGG
jgi:hypothetical protein